MDSAPGLNSISRSNRGEEIVLLGFVGLFFFICFMIAGRRSFNFDEFQVLYASASLLRGKAYFADRIGTHFPLFNTLMSVVITSTGYKTSALLVSRYVIFFAGVLTCLYTYLIASRSWNRSTGLLAAAILLSSVAFAEKGLEIRHDVFNTLFNVMAAYYGIRYLAEKKSFQLVACGLLLGMAIASTQKAVIWSFGIVLGLAATLLKDGEEIKDAGKVILALAALIPIPLVLCLIGLVTSGDESLRDFFRHAVLDRLPFLNPHVEDLFPFPHSRWYLLKELVKPNPLFYVSALAGLVLLALKKNMAPRGGLVLGGWCVLGLLFYLTMRRPFFQSFLPTLPPLAIMAGGLLMKARNASSRFPLALKAGIVLLCGILLFVWPLRFLVPMMRQDDRLYRQLYNTSYCLGNLKRGEKVLCFTQNQVYFDPVLPIKNSVCGERFYAYDPACFEQRMIEEQCRVIINDYRSQLLNREIKKKIQTNYIALQKGNILIPGFRLEPKTVVEKRVWIEGYYYSPTLSLEVDGQRVRSKLLRLTQGVHTFLNLRDRPLSLVYFFETGTSLETVPLQRFSPVPAG